MNQREFCKTIVAGVAVGPLAMLQEQSDEAFAGHVARRVACQQHDAGPQWLIPMKKTEFLET